MPNAVKVMRQNASPEALEGVWKAGFPGQIPDKLVIAEELKGNVNPGWALWSSARAVKGTNHV